MKIIDKTPFVNAKGQLEFSGRVQGIVRFGFSWPAELEVQKTVIAQMDRILEKGFVLIRNFILPDVEAAIPIILIGPGGISVIHVSNAKGQFEAKGDEWNNYSYGRGLPARINLLGTVMKYALALDVYLKKQRIQIPAPIQPVLIMANPGAHVETLRPAVHVYMSDAVKLFASTLAQERPVWRPSDNIFDIADRIVTPRPPQSAQMQAAQDESQADSERPQSRAGAIFDAADKAQPFNPADFAFDDGQPPLAPQGVPPGLRETSPAQPLPRTPKPGKLLGMTTGQLALLAAMFVIECCVLIGFAAFYFLNQ